MKSFIFAFIWIFSLRCLAIFLADAIVTYNGYPFGWQNFTSLYLDQHFSLTMSLIQVFLMKRTMIRSFSGTAVNLASAAILILVFEGSNDFKLPFLYPTLIFGVFAFEGLFVDLCSYSKIQFLKTQKN